MASTWKNIHIDDFGWIAALQIVQDGTPVDISGYTTRQFTFVKKDGTEIEKTATFETDGTDGWLQYVVEEGVIDTVGSWSVYARVSNGSAELTSNYVLFGVARR